MDSIALLDSLSLASLLRSLAWLGVGWFATVVFYGFCALMACHDHRALHPDEWER